MTFFRFGNAVICSDTVEYIDTVYLNGKFTIRAKIKDYNIL